MLITTCDLAPFFEVGGWGGGGGGGGGVLFWLYLFIDLTELNLALSVHSRWVRNSCTKTS